MKIVPIARNRRREMENQNRKRRPQHLANTREGFGGGRVWGNGITLQCEKRGKSQILYDGHRKLNGHQNYFINKGDEWWRRLSRMNRHRMVSRFWERFAVSAARVRTMFPRRVLSSPKETRHLLPWISLLLEKLETFLKKGINLCQIIFWMNAIWFL